MDVCPQLPDIAQGYGCTTFTFEVPWPNCASGRFHAGIDLWDSKNPTLQGQPVFATRSGKVIMLGQNSVLEGHDFGPNAVCLQTDEGPVIWYGHLSAAFVAVGDIVPIGGKIGAIGSLGVSTGPHLHLEARTNFPDPTGATQVVTGSINPTPYLSYPQGVDVPLNAVVDQAAFDAMVAQNPILAQMAARTVRQEDGFNALIWRVKALIDNLPNVEDGPTKGEVNQLKAELDSIVAKLPSK